MNAYMQLARNNGLNGKRCCLPHLDTSMHFPFVLIQLHVFALTALIIKSFNELKRSS